jgi:threonine/homoserine/homoserine lactone efflux protein
MIAAASFLPLAHAAHWYFLPLYLAPVLLVLYGAVRTARNERRKARDENNRA